MGPLGQIRTHIDFFPLNLTNRNYDPDKDISTLLARYLIRISWQEAARPNCDTGGANVSRLTAFSISDFSPASIQFDSRLYNPAKFSIPI